MGESHSGNLAEKQAHRGLATPRGRLRLASIAGALVLGTLLVASPPGGLRAASPAGPTCQFSPAGQITKDSGVEPYLMINGTCVDPDYNEGSFIIDKTEQLTFQVPGGALIPYTQVTGHWPATRTPETITPGITQSPTLFEQKYVFKFPAREFWKNRTFLQQHPTGGGMVDPRMAFTNGAITISWQSNSVPNAVATHRHEAAATKWANAYANNLYGNTAKIYNYFWGCSGGGVVSVGAAENTTGVWDGIQPQCSGVGGESLFHAFLWAAHYTMAIPQAKRDAIAAAAAPGGTGDIYAGLNEEEKAVLNEFIGAGYPLQIIGQHFKNPIPLVDPIDIRIFDQTYEDDFWSKPGYAGANPPNYLKAALTDGWATVTRIDRDAEGNPTAIQLDPATLPRLGVLGTSYLEFWVYGPDGKTRIVDPVRITVGVPTLNKRRFSLLGNFDAKTGLLRLTGALPEGFERGTPITNSQMLLDGVKVGGKLRVNNRFILAMYFYPRYSNIPGARGHDQYRNANGSAKHPQRKDIAVLAHPTFRTMGGRIETGNINAKIMIIEGRSDNLAWPIVNVSYAERVRRALGARADSQMRFYMHDNGRHAVGGGEPGIFQQSMQDMMAWVERGVAPLPSTAYTIRNGQVVPPDEAAARHGLQPVMNLTANGAQRATVRVNQPVDLAARLEMPPRAGQIVQYAWSVAGSPAQATVVEKPQTLVNANRTIMFDKPGTYVVRLTVNGQRDGMVNPPNQTLLQNWKEIQVVVE